MSKSMKFVAIAALGLGVFQNFGAEAVKIVSTECPKGLCVVKADNEHEYTLDEASKKAIYDAMKNVELKESDSKKKSGSKLTGQVEIDGHKVDLSFDQKK